MAKKRRAKSKRRYVNRRERVEGPTPETRARLPSDPFPEWVKLGEAGGGLEPQQVSALLNLADAFMSVTAKLTFKPMLFSWSAPGAPRDMSPAETRAWTLWFAWAIHFERRAKAEGRLINGFRVAQWVLARDRKTNAGERADPRLAVAANLWARIAADYDRGIAVNDPEYHPAIEQRPVEPERTRIRTWAQPQPA